jgi:voltage-gated potassium channel
MKKRVINDVLMVILALISVFLLIIEVVSNLNSEQIQLIQYVDITIALIFLADFIYQFYTAKDRVFFLKTSWWEILAAIPITNPTTQILRSIKLARALPLIETFRFVRFATRVKIILEASKKYTRHTYLIYLVTIVGVITLAGAWGFYYFEYPANQSVHNFWDSVYWAITTLTTVGAGDIYATTTGGRIITILLIFSGVGTLGALIATIDSYVIRHEKI